MLRAAADQALGGAGISADLLAARVIFWTWRVQSGQVQSLTGKTDRRSFEHENDSQGFQHASYRRDVAGKHGMLCVERS